MRHYSLVLIFLVISCSGGPGLIGFDAQRWKEDIMGCKEDRLVLIDQLMERKSELTGLGQEEVVELIGKPDMHELYSRNKKSFTYYLSNGPDCDQADDNPPKLIVRFDGLGRSKDIIYYEKLDKTQ